MPGNRFGETLQLVSFGESHGAAVGGVLDGYPPGITVDHKFIEHQLARRRPGQSAITTSRNESDAVEFLSGIFQGKTTGTPIAFIIRNRDARPEEYENVAGLYRPSHAGFTYIQKYGHADHRGGGRASARETAVRVVAGAMARILLQSLGVRIAAYAIQIGEVKLDRSIDFPAEEIIDNSPVRCPDAKVSKQMITHLEKVKAEKDSTGGVVECRITGCPPGLGEPVFSKINADLAAAVMSINAATGFETGTGFGSASMRGSQHNDPFVVDNDKIRTLTNNSGGIQGGLTNGNEVIFRVAFKPAPGIGRKQKTVDHQGKETEFSLEGRHDPCVVPRAVPVVEAMAALVIADHWLRDLKYQFFRKK